MAGYFTGEASCCSKAMCIVWPVLIAVTVAFIILGLFKKAAAKAV